MTTSKTELSLEVYQIKVTLRYTRPPIWRRLLVPASLTLERLHNVLQVAMGWDDSHLHEFHFSPKRVWQPDPRERSRGLQNRRNESSLRLSVVLGRVGATALYTYDFGDGWEHTIVVEKILPPEPGVLYPLCVGGKRQGPPEDCGGIPGYYRLLEAIRDPSHQDHEEMLEWVGDDFDPEAFSVDTLNRSLASLQRHYQKPEAT